MGVEIRSHKGPKKPVMDFEIELVNLDELIPHEQIIDRELKWFTEEVVKTGVVHWPMLIAKDSHLILDGHHRTAGLKKLNYKNGPAIILDYFNDDLIKLDTWYPLVKNSVDEVVSALNVTGIEVKKLQNPTIDLELLGDRKITAYVGNSNELYNLKGEREKIFQIIRNLWIDKTAYYDDPEVCFENTYSDFTAILSWSYTKEEILEHVSEGMVHLPKTTRHELSYRVPKCDFPLEKLDKK